MKLLFDVGLQAHRTDAFDVPGPRTKPDPVEHVDDRLVVRVSRNGRRGTLCRREGQSRRESQDSERSGQLPGCPVSQSAHCRPLLLPAREGAAASSSSATRLPHPGRQISARARRRVGRLVTGSLDRPMRGGVEEPGHYLLMNFFHGSTMAFWGPEAASYAAAYFKNSVRSSSTDLIGRFATLASYSSRSTMKSRS